VSEQLNRTMIGSVISLSGNKSRVALIQRTVKHQLLGKIMKRSTKISFHDEDNVCAVGDKVKIKETRPISKSKSWELIEVIKKFEGVAE
jgi:small subunit ribosomal protein S17